jgi:hypothetical protein
MSVWNLVSWLLPRNAAYAFAFVSRKAAGTQIVE